MADRSAWELDPENPACTSGPTRWGCRPDRTRHCGTAYHRSQRAREQVSSPLGSSQRNAVLRSRQPSSRPRSQSAPDMAGGAATHPRPRLRGCHRDRFARRAPRADRPPGRHSILSLRATGGWPHPDRERPRRSRLRLSTMALGTRVHHGRCGRWRSGENRWLRPELGTWARQDPARDRAQGADGVRVKL